MQLLPTHVVQSQRLIHSQPVPELDILLLSPLQVTASPPFNLNAPDVPNPDVTFMGPTPLEIPMCDYVVKAGAQSLFKVLWDETSEPMNRVATAEVRRVLARMTWA